MTDATLPEFVLRHTEIVRLVELIGRRLHAAEPNALVATQLAHLPNWYRAVVWRGSWSNTSETAAGIIAATDLNYLELFGDNEKYNDNAQVPEADLKHLRAILDDWGALLDESPDIPERLRRQIRSQVEHIKWLLDHVDLLGPTPVVRETQTLLGQVTAAGGVQPGRFTSKRGWVTVLAGIVMFLAGVEQATGSVAAITGDAQVALTNVHKMYEEVSRSQPPALPAGEDNGPRALPPGATSPDAGP